MLASVYIASDGSILTMEDLIDWLRACKIYNPEWERWDFDQITGGVDEFLKPRYYYEMKDFYKKYIEK